MMDLDDDEEEEMGCLTGVEYSEDIWWCQNAEHFEEYKEWEAGVDRQEVRLRNNQMTLYGQGFKHLYSQMHQDNCDGNQWLHRCTSAGTLSLVILTFRVA